MRKNKVSTDLKLVSKLLTTIAFSAALTMYYTGMAQDSTPELEAWLNTNEHGASADDSEGWDDIIGKAWLEGEVVVYSMSGRIAKLTEHFNNLCPEIKLALFDLGSVKTIEKTMREQDAIFLYADIISTGHSG